MKIAIVTNDGRSISAHFGKARQFLVLTVENGEVVERETRDKPAHEHGHHHHTHADSTPVTMHDSAPALEQHEPHNQNAAIIHDCQVVLSRGMGKPMYNRLQANNIRVVLTNVVLIDEAVAAFLAGVLAEHPELVH